MECGYVWLKIVVNRRDFDSGSHHLECHHVVEVIWSVCVIHVCVYVCMNTCVCVCMYECMYV